MAKQRIFISSVQGEFREERAALADCVRRDPVLDRVFDVFLFEEVSASPQAPSDVYLDVLSSSEIYAGLFGCEYGSADSSGKSPTEREYRKACELRLHRSIFLKAMLPEIRDPRMRALVEEVQESHVRKSFRSLDELVQEFRRALGEYLEAKSTQGKDFDRSICEEAEIGDLDAEKMEEFLRQAKAATNFGLPGPVSPENTLSHLKMVSGGRPTHAAVLMFGKEPQKFIPASSVKCMWFEGTEHAKPMRSYKLCEGSVLELIKQAVDFTLDKVDLAVGRRENGLEAPRTYEIPVEVVTEAIVNAIIHRDYTLHGSVQVMLYSDRFEVLNPGGLPPGLSIENLSKSRESEPRNESLARTLRHTSYSEEAGTGIANMMLECAGANLPAPEFSVDGWFSIKIWRARRKVASVTVVADSEPAGDVDVLAVSPEGWSTRAKTSADGVALLDISSPRLPTTIFAARPDLSATVARGWIPATDSLALELESGPADGSVIFTESGGFLPGFSGRLERFRDHLGRHCLRAPELRVNDGETQPVRFELGQTLDVTDCRGRVAQVRFVDVEGGFSLLEFRMRRDAHDVSPDEMRVLELLRQGPQSQSGLAKGLGMSRNSKKFLDTIRFLAKKGMIEQIRPGSSGGKARKFRLSMKGSARLPA